MSRRLFLLKHLSSLGSEEGQEKKELADNRAGGVITLRERRFPNRLNVSDPGKSSLWFTGVVSRLGSRRSVRLLFPQVFHEPERRLSPTNLVPKFNARICRGILILTLAWAFALNSSAAVTTDAFAQGVELSRAGEFPEATAAFQRAAQARPAVGTYLNLGLSEWNRGHAGKAILAWEQARWIDPRDDRAVGNLAFARQVAEVDTPQLTWFEVASSWLPPNDWVWIAGASLWLAVGAIMLPRILRRSRRGWQQTLAALGLGAFLFSVTANLGVVSRTSLGFVVKKTAPLLLTPTREGEVISSLNAGEPGRRLRTRGDYYYVRTAGAAGWIEKSGFDLVCPDRN